jgi:ADP-ribose pyrophosphatase YjhB (NUDIX family)
VFPFLSVYDPYLCGFWEDKDDKLLLVRRKKDPFKGSLSFPGGKVDEGEIILKNKWLRR